MQSLASKLTRRIVSAAAAVTLLASIGASGVLAGGPPSLGFYVDDVRYRTVGTPTDFFGTGAPESTLRQDLQPRDRYQRRRGQARRPRLQRRPVARLRRHLGRGRHARPVHERRADLRRRGRGPADDQPRSGEVVLLQRRAGARLEVRVTEPHRPSRTGTRTRSSPGRDARGSSILATPRTRRTSPMGRRSRSVRRRFERIAGGLALADIDRSRSVGDSGDAAKPERTHGIPGRRPRGLDPAQVDGLDRRRPGGLPADAPRGRRRDGRLLGEASRTGRSSPTSSPARSPRSSRPSRPRIRSRWRRSSTTSGGSSSRTRRRGTTPGSWPTSRRRARPPASPARCSWPRSPRTCSCGGRRRSGPSSRPSSSRGSARRSACPRGSMASSPTPPRSGRSSRSPRRARRPVSTPRTAGSPARPELGQPRVYASAEAHSSIDKACMTLGLGRDALVHVPTDDALPAASRRARGGDRRGHRGRAPPDRDRRDARDDRLDVGRPDRAARPDRGAPRPVAPRRRRVRGRRRAARRSAGRTSRAGSARTRSS